MALKIRLARGGAKKRPFYRIVVADSRSPRDGRFIEKIGRYNPLAPAETGQRVILDIGAAKSWLDKGARPTDRVARFMSHIHYREIPATEYEAMQASAAETGGDDAAANLPDVYASANEGMVLVTATDADSDAKQLFGWAHGNNPNKGKPGQKALERIEEKKEKAEARKAAEEEAKREAEEAAKAAAEAAKAEAEAAKAAEAEAAEKPAEDTGAEDTSEPDAAKAEG